jgi:hypothetical protein
MDARSVTILQVSAGLGAVATLMACGPVAADGGATAHRWHVGEPIATYWAGPPMTEATARQMADGGFNLVWCTEAELDTAQRFGLRAMLQDPLIAPASLDDADKRGELDALVARVKGHPALYAYFITDEPSAAAFPSLGRLVAHLRERDPAHLGYINLFPTYASNEQLGTEGDVETAYAEHLRQYIDVVRPGLVSYDHYHFGADGDSGQYFLNLGMIRKAALDAGLPFLNIVQASSWTPSMRIPNPDELTWLVYTSLAYGAQGISYFVYYYPTINGGLAHEDGTTTVLYDRASRLNREFVAAARELAPLRSLGAYHLGETPRGAEPLPADAPVSVTPVPASGLVVGLFGEGDEATHAVVVNLDYAHPVEVTLATPGRADRFDRDTLTWRESYGGRWVPLRLPPGGGALVRWSP